MELIVGDHESLVGMFGDVADAFCPGFEFVFFVEIVVALGRRDERIIREPSVVAASVKTNASFAPDSIRWRKPENLAPF